MIKDMAITIMWASIGLMALGFFVLLLTMGYWVVYTVIVDWRKEKKELIDKAENDTPK